MNKTELIDKIAEDAGISKADAKKALEAIIKHIGKALREGQSIALVGFGTFSVSKRAARTGRNLQTGKIIKISAKNVVKFKASNSLLKEGTGDGGPRSK